MSIQQEAAIYCLQVAEINRMRALNSFNRPALPIDGIAGYLFGDYDLCAHIIGADHLTMRQHDLEIGQLFGLILKKDSTKEIVIVLRGTSTIDEWVHNLKINSHKLPNDGGKVVSSFYETYKSLTVWGIGSRPIDSPYNSYLTNYISNIKRGYQIRLVGHSLGAAVATYCLQDLISSNIQASMVGIASPMVGDDRYMEKFESTCRGQYQVINYINDLVPKLPPLCHPFKSVHHITPDNNQALINDHLLVARHHSLCYAAMLDYALSNNWDSLVSRYMFNLHQKPILGPNTK
jgi:hypothetical protein